MMDNITSTPNLFGRISSDEIFQILNEVGMRSDFDSFLGKNFEDTMDFLEREFVPLKEEMDVVQKREFVKKILERLENENKRVLNTEVISNNVEEVIKESVESGEDEIGKGKWGLRGILKIISTLGISLESFETGMSWPDFILRVLKRVEEYFYYFQSLRECDQNTSSEFYKFAQELMSEIKKIFKDGKTSLNEEEVEKYKKIISSWEKKFNDLANT